MKTKTCTKCGVKKPLDEFYYGRAECRACNTIRSRANRLQRKNNPAPAPADLPPGVIGLKEAAAIVHELTGFKCSANEMRNGAAKFRHIARWRVGNNGADKLVGISKARLEGLIQGRLAVRGRPGALKDLFSTGEI